MPSLDEILATATRDRQLGVQRFLCGCVVNERGALEEYCRDVITSADEGRALIRRGFSMTPEERSRLAEIQGSLAKHVRQARAALRKAKAAA